ncbi:hypothetical protein, partial [Chitiniphilus eburneus]
ATTPTGIATLNTPLDPLDALADQAAAARAANEAIAGQTTATQAEAAAEAERQLEDELLLNAALAGQTLRENARTRQLDTLLARREVENALGGLGSMVTNPQAGDISRVAPDAPLSTLPELAARSAAVANGGRVLADELLTAALAEPAPTVTAPATPAAATVTAATQPDPRMALEQRLIHDALTPGVGNTQPYMVYGTPANPALNPVRDTYMQPDRVVNPVAASKAVDEVMSEPVDTAGLVRSIGPRR